MTEPYKLLYDVKATIAVAPPVDKNKYLITSALPYINNIPHLGNIIGCVLSADVYVRYMRNRYGDENIMYVCGTDEYGTTTEVKAHEEGLTCQEICDKYYHLHKEIYEYFNISTNIFGRTTTSTQTELAQEIFLKLYDNGHLIEKEVEQMHCETCEKPLADRQISGFCYHAKCAGKNVATKGDQCDECGNLIDATNLVEPSCIVCKSSPKLILSDHLFIDLPVFADKLKDYYFVQNKCKLNKNAISITNNFLQEGLIQRQITRDLKWGTPIPTNRDGLKKYAGKVMYVWFDAPIGYLSILKHGTTEDEWKQWSDPNVKWTQFMAKDNVPFHTLIFPSTLFGYNSPEHSYPIVTEISSTEYLSHEGEKFSKSKNVGVFGNHVKSLCEKLDISIDYFRYYLLKIRPETKDASFSWKEFLVCTQADLVNNYGNLANRCISLTKKYFPNEELFLDNEKFATEYEELIKLLQKYEYVMNDVSLREGLSIALEISNSGNLFLQNYQPWDMYNKYKKTGDESVLQNIKEVISFSLYITHVASKALEPFVPTSGKYIMDHMCYNAQTKTFSVTSSKYIMPFRRVTCPELISCLDQLQIPHHLIEVVENSNQGDQKGPKVQKNQKNQNAHENQKDQNAHENQKNQKNQNAQKDQKNQSSQMAV